MYVYRMMMKPLVGRVGSICVFLGTVVLTQYSVRRLQVFANSGRCRVSARHRHLLPANPFFLYVTLYRFTNVVHVFRTHYRQYSMKRDSDVLLCIDRDYTQSRRSVSCFIGCL